MLSCPWISLIIEQYWVFIVLNNILDNYVSNVSSKSLLNPVFKNIATSSLFFAVQTQTELLRFE